MDDDAKTDEYTRDDFLRDLRKVVTSRRSSEGDTVRDDDAEQSPSKSEQRKP